MSPKDRDQLEPKHPRPQSEPKAEEDDGEWGPDSNVSAPAYTGQRPSSPAKPQQSASARAAFRKIDELGRKFDSHAEIDQKALEAIHEKLEKQDKVLEKQDKVLASQNETLTTIRIDAAATSSATKAIERLMTQQHEIQKIEVQGELTAKVERMSGRTKIILALVAVLATAVGAFAKWLAG